MFYKPFEGSISRKELGEEEKFNFFLPLFASILEDPMKYNNQWREEYNNIILGYKKLHKDGGGNIESYGDISLVILSLIEPIHYYALFSATVGFDMSCQCTRRIVMN